MKISDILSKDCVFAQILADNKRELLRGLSVKAAQSVGIDEHIAADSVLERENLGSTGYGRGTAFPHARIDSLQEIRGVFAQLAKPIDFDAVDKKPVDLVFLLISPENSGADHLAALAAVSRILKDENVCAKLRSAKNSEEIFDIFNSLA